jgi:hypothetical protein
LEVHEGHFYVEFSGRESFSAEVVLCCRSAHLQTTTSSGLSAISIIQEEEERQLASAMEEHRKVDSHAV